MQGAWLTTEGIARSELLPPILEGCRTAAVEEKVRRFLHGVPEMLERWITRCQSQHTQRAYRQDVLTFLRFLQLDWPRQAPALLTVTVGEVHRYRDWLLAQGAAPKTVNRRIASLSGFFRFLREVAAELRLPLQVANPADAQFIRRENADPVAERLHLSAAKARLLLSLPAGESLLDYRDRAILKFYVYSGARLATGCRLQVADFHDDEHDPTIRLSEKGNRRRTIGLNHLAAAAIRAYLERAGLTDGPLFRGRLNPRSTKLGSTPLDPSTMYRLLRRYFERLPGAVRETADPTHSGRTRRRCLYTPHSTRATNATLLLEAGEDIRKVQELLGHRHVTTTQIYDKRRRQTADSASHRVPI